MRTQTLGLGLRLGFATLACAPLSVALGEGSELPDGSVVISSLPFVGTGDTSDNLDDYDAVCPWASTSPDVFYAYTPDASVLGISLFLCDSQYDTKVFVLDAAFNEIACNDDACSSQPPFRSKIDCLPVTPGETIHIAIDGWSGDAGIYDIVVETCIPPRACIFGEGPGVPACPDGAIAEGEPCVEDAPDTVNGGCDSTPAPLFTSVDCGDTICGQLYQTALMRDTDWFELDAPADADVTITGVGESALLFGRVFDSACVPGAPSCDCIAGTISPFATTLACEEASRLSAVVAGTSWWFISVDTPGAIPCGSELPGNDYFLSWTCTYPACCPLGDANTDGIVDFADLVILLANWGPCGG